MKEDKSLEPSKEDIKKLASCLADIIIEEPEQVFPVIINIEDIVDLDKLVSSEAGLMDPLGQLKSWLTDMLNSIASWVADTVSSAVDRMIGGLKSFIDSALGGVKSFIEELIGGVTSAISTLESTVKKVVIDPLGKVIESAQKFLADLPKTIGGITGAVEGVITSLSESISGVADTVSKWFESLKATFSDTLKTFQDVISSAVKGISDIVGEAGKTLTSMVSGLVSSLQESFTKLMESASGVVGKLIESVQASFKSVEEWFSGLSQAFSDAMKTFSEMISSAGEGITKMISDVGATLSDTISNLISGAQELVGQLVDAIGGGLGKLQESLGEIFGSVGKWFEELGGAFTGAMKTFGDMINSAVKGISDMVSKAGETLSTTISGLIEGVQKSFAGLIESVQKGISGVIESIQGVFKQVGEWFEGLRTAFEGTMKTFSEMISSAVEGIKGLVSKAGETIGNWVAGFFKQIEGINKLITELIDTLVKAPEKIPEALMSIAETIWGNLIKPVYDRIYETIIKPLQDHLSNVIKNVQTGFDVIGKAFTGFINAVTRLPEMLWALLPDWLKEAIEKMKEAIDSFVSGLKDFLKDPIQFIKDRFEELAKWIWKHLPDEIKNAITGIQEAISDFVDKLKDFLEDPIGSLKEGFSWLAEQIWEALPEDIKNAMIGLYNIWEAFVSGLKAFLEDPIKFIQDRFKEFAEWLWEHLPDEVKNALIGLYEMWRSFVSGLKAFLEDPVKFIQDRLREFTEWIWGLLPDWLKNAIIGIQDFFVNLWKSLANFFTKQLPNFFNWVGEQVDRFLKDPMGMLKEITKSSINTMGWALGVISEIVKKGLQWFVTGFLTLMYGLVGTTIGIVRTTMNAILGLMIKAFKEGINLVHEASSKVIELTKAPEEAKLGEAGVTLILINSVLSAHTIASTISNVVGGLAETVDNVEVGGSGEAKGEPLGVGIAGRLLGAIRAKIGALFSWFGKSFKKHADYFLMSILIAFWFWNFEWIRYVLRSRWIYTAKVLENKVLAFEIPTLSESIRLLQRYYPTKYTGQLFEYIRDTLYFRGYPYWFYEHVTSPVKDVYSRVIKDVEDLIKETYIVHIKDRFGVPRAFPTTPFFSIPTGSELSRMMIRDIIIEPKQFKLAMLMRGYTPDVSTMYYLLHFRYPPIERLWSFLCRGISNILWFKRTKEMDEDIKRETVGLGLDPTKWITVDPLDLNKKYTMLFNAFSRYMKWHDYNRVAWMNNFTSDNMILLDTLADIPMKIDIRWMVKWGIFEEMTGRGIKMETPASEFTTVLDDEAENKKVTMDLTLMCRLLQATGLHPYYVPIVSVAEAINALADERVFLRTGIVDMYRYGGCKFETIENLMKELTIASFKVAYFDIESRSWVLDKWFNLPVMFLPAERKLLELRALLDRYNRLFRDVRTDVETAYKQFIFDRDECVDALKRVVDSINKLFPETAKEIVGREVKFEVDEDYIKTVIDSLEVERVIYTYRRVRAWFFRILGWMIYRLAYAYVTIEDVEELINIAKEYAKLTDKEVEGLRRISSLLIDIASREYIPTPTTLAVISEVVPRASRLFPILVKRLRIPKEWVPIWREYIKLRPVIDEVKRLVTTLITGYAKTYITDEEWTKFEEFLKKFGYTKDELTILKTIATLRRRFYELREMEREYVPTPSMLVSLAEYITLPNELIEKVFEAKHVPEEWRKIWRTLIEVRPLANDIRSLLTTYRRALIYIDIPEEIKKKVEEYAGLINFTDVEWDILRLRVRLEELIRQSREYIPSPSMLVSFAEYLVLPEELIEEVFERRNIPKKWRGVWTKLINIRPIADDVRGLLTSFRRALVYTKVPEEIEKKVQEYAKLVGFTEREWDILKLRVTLEELALEARESRREYIPTPAMLATIVEVVPEAKELMEAVFRARRVPVEWTPIWSKYIIQKPVVDELKRLVTTLITGYSREYISKDEWNKAMEFLSNFGWTEDEIKVLTQIAELRKAFYELREMQREYIPTPSMLATICEVVPEAKELMKVVFEKKHVPQEWIPIWSKYIVLKPVVDEVKRLVTTLITGYARTYITDGEWELFAEFLGKIGYTKDELSILKTIATLRKRYYDMREMGREYIPTPSMLATISEIIPEARALFSSVVRERHVPAEWVPIWRKYVAVKPIVDEVKKVLSSTSRLYEYFMIREEDFKKFLSMLKVFGYEDSEIKLILDNVTLDRWYRAYRELIGTPKELVTMAEYSPMARELALAEVYKMIDALPVEQNTKDFLKKMWEQYIRVKPVYDEVKREITELITDYAREIITWEEFVKLLEELKKWGIDEYEIDAYKFIAMMRRERYKKRSR